MKIKSTHPESQGEFVIIEDSDFDEKTHVPYVDQEEPAKRGRKPKDAETE